MKTDKKVITVRLDTGVRTGLLVSEGPKFFGVIFPDAAAIRVTRILKADRPRITEALYHRRPYPVTRCKRKLLAMGRRNKNITKGARRHLGPGS